MQLGAGNNIESTWLGGFNWASQAQAWSDDQPAVLDHEPLRHGSFPGVRGHRSRAMQQIAYSSELNSVEMNYRQRWVGPNVRVQGSWLAGVRFVELEEDFTLPDVRSGQSRLRWTTWSAPSTR